MALGLLGVIELKDIVKEGIRERFAEMRAMGIRTVMITGDNPLTAAAIAQEAGVDDYLAEATPEAKMAFIKAEQEGGKLVAMTGDGTNDAPALAQADVGVAMNTGTTAAKEAGNMVDLDSNPTKLIDIVEIGKQLLITRGALTTFSIANDVAKYFAIIPALFAATYPQLKRAQHHAAAQPAERRALRRDLQRAGHRRPHPAGPARGAVPALDRRRDPAPQRLHLRRRRESSRPSSSSSSSISSSPRRGPSDVRQRCAGHRPLDCLLRPARPGLPLAETGIGQTLFARQANGSLTSNGSVLVGQSWTGPRWFQGRPDADNPMATGGSNLGPRSETLVQDVPSR
jgi:soluble P-type ATPase